MVVTATDLQEPVNALTGEVGPANARILLRNVSHRFGRRQALDDVDLTVGTGVFGLLGPNGAGKTTLLRVLATVLRPSDGNLCLLGREPHGGDNLRYIRQRLGYLPQQFGYYPNFTAFEFVEYFALLKEMDPTTIHASVARAIRRVGLEAEAKTKLKALSGGMLRRVGIAQAIVNDPHLLLLDEPTVGLDPEQRVRFRALLREIGNEATVFVSTHLVEDVAAACTELALMEEGRIVFHGSPVDLSALGGGLDLADMPEASGASVMERGYTAALGRSRRERT